MVKPQLLSLLEINSQRGAAYGKLNQAMRASGKPGTLANHFETTCASVTEELRLASEGVMSLRTVLLGLNSDNSKTAVQWLDSLQDLEEKRLVALVSLHALHRSKAASKLDTCSEPVLSPEELDAKLSKYAKELQLIDSEINDLLAEVREFVAEEN